MKPPLISIQTGRTIIITTYGTALRRLIKTGKPVRMTAADLQAQADFEQLRNGANEDDDDVDEFDANAPDI